MRIAVTSASIHPAEIAPPQHHPQDVAVDYHFASARNVPYRSQAMSGKLHSKIPKMLGHELFPDYDVYIWLDDALSLVRPDAVRWFVETLGTADFGLFLHPERGSISEEMEYVQAGLAHGDPRLTARYRNEPMQAQVAGYLAHPGFDGRPLYMGTAFVYRNTLENQYVLRSWFYECCRWTQMDQISLPFIMQQHQRRVSVLPGSAYNTPYMRWGQ